MHLSGDILQASDDLSHVINSYKKIVEGQIINGETEEAQQTQLSVRQGKVDLVWAENCVSSLYVYSIIIWPFDDAVSDIFLREAFILCVSQLFNAQWASM